LEKKENTPSFSRKRRGGVGIELRKLLCFWGKKKKKSLICHLKKGEILREKRKRKAKTIYSMEKKHIEGRRDSPEGSALCVRGKGTDPGKKLIESLL